MAEHWHKLTLEELICLTEARPLGSSRERSRGTAEKRTQETTQSHDRHVNIDQPPKAEVQDDLYSYIFLRWCPWYSHTFGVISEVNLNTLTAKLLSRTVERDKSHISLELLTGVTLVLTQPNIPYQPKHPNSTLARTSLIRT